MDSQTPPYRTYETPPLTGPDGPVETVAVIGYGNQGKAQALNIRDSGLPVTVGLRKNSPNRKIARGQLFDVEDIETASREASAIAMLVPDEFIHEIAEIVQANAKPGSILLLAHGASLYYERWKLKEEFDCGLIAPHGPGIVVRRLFAEGSGVPAMLAEIQDTTGRCSKRIELIAATIGCARKGAGVRWTSLREEVETDLFVEQALLVGGVIELLRAVVSTMVHAGYDPAICRMSTLYELPIMTSVY
ncbi:MAG: NAD(P)-binding domain-containing protein, partial [bacterium]|nr:NAD(P)-binding domain-containing protein [bacterium]